MDSLGSHQYIGAFICPAVQSYNCIKRLHQQATLKLYTKYYAGMVCDLRSLTIIYQQSLYPNSHAVSEAVDNGSIMIEKCEYLDSRITQRQERLIQDRKNWCSNGNYAESPL